MVEKLTAALPETGRLAVMLNNLGGVSVAEMAILTRELANTPLQARIDWLIGPASLVTALDMKGFSLTAIVLEESIEKALLSDVETASWQKPVQPRTINVVPSTLDSARVDFTPSANPQVGDYVAQVTGALIDLEEHLNALDAKVGDGDTGSTFAAGAREIAAERSANALRADRRTPDGGDGRLQRGIDVYLLHRCRAEAGARRQRGRGAERRSGTDEVLRRRR